MKLDFTSGLHTAACIHVLFVRSPPLPARDRSKGLVQLLGAGLGRNEMVF